MGSLKDTLNEYFVENQKLPKEDMDRNRDSVSSISNCQSILIPVSQDMINGSNLQA